MVGTGRCDDMTERNGSIVKAPLSAKPKTSARGHQLGIRHKLYLAFAAAAAMTVVASLVAWFNFTRIGESLDDITARRVPGMAASLELAQLSAQIAAAAPVLAGAANDSERQQIQSALKAEEAAMQVLLGRIEAMGEKSAAATLRQNATDLTARLDELNRGVQERLTIAGQRAERLAGLRAAHDSFLQTVAPMLDDTSFAMSIAMSSVAEKGNAQQIARELAKLGDNELASLEAILRLVSEVNQLAGILAESAMLPRREMLAPVGDRLTASAARLRKNLDTVDKIEKNPKLRAATDAVLAFGSGDASLLDLRKRELERDGAAAASLKAARDIATRFGAEVSKIVASAQEGNAIAARSAAAAISGGETLLLIVTIVSLAGAAALAYLYVGRNIAMRLDALVRAMRAIAGGTLDAKIPASGRDEIGEMAQALVVFRDNASAIRQADSRAEAERRKSADERRADMQRLAGELEASVKQVVDRLSKAASQLHTTATAMSETATTASERSNSASASAQQASGNVQTVAAASEELSSSISEISRQVTQSAKMAGQGVESARNTNSSVEGLAEAAQKIGDVVKLINDIAGQTNLLALNATIEAARAGEAGKGFAVVASEVKSLATQTAKATEDIAAQVAAIQGATRSSVDAIKGIGGIVHEINDIAAAIAAAVEQQGAATQEIARNIQQAAAGTNAVSADIGEVAQAATRTGVQANDILAAAGQMSQQAELLDGEVQRLLARIRAA
jgi:methyl-accepting chemotaxis protein